MNRKQLARKICKIVEKSVKIKISELYNTKFDKNEYRNGLYFLFSKNNKCIYVGLVGPKPSTSLYKRNYGHGTGAHCKQKWFAEVQYAKWHRFEVSEEDLATYERLAIFYLKQPIYNDKDTNSKTIKQLYERTNRELNK